MDVEDDTQDVLSGVGWALIYYLTGSFLFSLGREPSLLPGFLKIIIFFNLLKNFFGHTVQHMGS